MKFRMVVILAFITLATSCQHLVVGNTCISCVNNPITGEAANYDDTEYSVSVNENSRFIDYPLTRGNFFHYWSSLQENPFEEKNIKKIASTFYLSYLQANEFEAPKKLKEITPHIKNDIKSVSEHLSQNYYLHKIRLQKYNFNEKSFPVSIPKVLFPKSDSNEKTHNNDAQLHLVHEKGTARSMDFYFPVPEKEAEKAARDFRRRATLRIEYKLLSTSEKCLSVDCRIYAKPVKIGMYNYNEQLIGVVNL